VLSDRKKAVFISEKLLAMISVGFKHSKTKKTAEKEKIIFKL
jgi:hypothetical protein